MARERNGARKRRDSFPKRVPDLGYYFIVTDTKETERNYLYGLRDALPAQLQGRMVIKVSSAKTGELVKTCEQSSVDPQYRQCWIVFDRDKVAAFDAIIQDAMLNRFGNESEAIQIAEKRLETHWAGGETRPSQMCPGTTLHHLVDEIRQKVRQHQN